jgi:hypothetical protein
MRSHASHQRRKRLGTLFPSSFVPYSSVVRGPLSRQMSLMICFGRQAPRTGTNQPPIAHPVP